MFDIKENLIIIKRDGREEPFQMEKLLKVINWATDNRESFTNSILKNFSIKITNKIKISYLYDELIKTTANMISPLYPVYDDVAKKLYVMKIYKEICNLKKSGEYPPLQDFISKGIRNKIYDRKILMSFSKDEINELNKMIVPDRDFLFTYKGLRLMISKYSRVIKGKPFELPQITYMMAAMYSFYNDIDKRNKKWNKKNKNNRLKYIKESYDMLSKHELSLATPRIANSMLTNAQLASCILNTPDDDTWSLNQTDGNMAMYSKFSGGIAYDVSFIRSSGSIIQSNRGRSDGPIPFIKRTEQTISSFNQCGFRKGSCVITFPWWHMDVMDLVMLKDAGGTEDTRARKLMYCLKINEIFRKRVNKDEDITLFDPKDVPLLNKTWGKDFENIYINYENMIGIRKKKIRAKDLLFNALKVRQETGNLYLFFADNVNNQNLRNVYVGASNLCVGGDTRILTKKGNIRIKELEGQEIECWNGTQWSMTRIEKTNDFADVMEIKLSDGETIIATPYHKWYKLVDYGKPYKEVRTKDLKVNDKLEKLFFNDICVEGKKDLPMAYENGFFSADGTEFDRGKIHTCRLYFYKDKKFLINFCSGYNLKVDSGERSYIEYRNNSKIKPKFFIPSGEYNIKSRLLWLSGLLDGDGYVTNNNGAESIQLSSINKDFLLSIKSMLLELGIISKVIFRTTAMKRWLPANNGSNEKKLYSCKEANALIIPGSELYKLIKLGFHSNRIKISNRIYQRQATAYVKVLSINNLSKKIPTYCGHEPLKHKLVFNGVLTGQCQEIVVPSSPSTLLSEKIYYNNSKEAEIHTIKKSGEIGICNLISVNLVKWFEFSDKKKEEFMYNLLRGCDNIIDTQFYPVAEGEFSNKKNRPIGVGVTNYANLLASNKLKYTDKKAEQFTFDIFEDLYYWVYKISNKLAIERGSYATFKGDKWASGMTPVKISRFDYRKFGLEFKNKKRWDELSNSIKNYGVRFSLHSAIAPTATTGKVISATESIEPIVDLFFVEEGTYSLPSLAPNLKQNREYYERCWNIPPRVLIKLAAIRQMFIDQSQSVNLYYTKPESAKELWDDIQYAMDLGVKTLYYMKTPKSNFELEEVCESCT